MRTATGITATPTVTRPASPTTAVLQRKCACGGETMGGGECAQCRKKREGLLQRSALSAARAGEVPDIVYDVLREPGRPLDRATRTSMESRFGRDLSAVRVHSGPRAAASAAAVDARAFTVGRSIVLGEHAGTSNTVASRRLLGHELAHTVQQGFAQAPARGLSISTDAASEHQAERAGDAVASGRAAGTLTSVSAGGVQREEAKPAGAPPTPDAELGWIEDALIEAVALPAKALGDTPYRLVKATLRGFAIEVKTQAKTKGPAFLDKVKEILKSPTKAALFVLHYWWGLIKGIFSPITGLFDLAKLVVKLQLMQMQVMSTVWTRRAEIAKRADQLATDMGLLAIDGVNAVAGFRKEPLKTLQALLPWLSSLGGKAEAAAFTGGRQAGGILMGALDKEPAELGEITGEVVGTVAVNVVLFIFTEGIGNAITQIASKLGEVGAWLGKFGKAAQMLEKLVGGIAELLTTVGGWIAKAEAAFAKMAEAVLKPLAPVLERFGKVVGGLREFLRDMLGVAKTEGAAAVETATTATAKSLEHAPAPAPTPKVTSTAPPPVAAKPVVKPSTPAVKVSAPPAAAADAGAEGLGAKAAPKDVPPASTPHTDVVPPKAAPRGKLFEGISPETEALLAERPGLAKALAEHPNAADLFKLCESQCFPSFMTDEEIVGRLVTLERMEAEATKAGVTFDRRAVKKLLHKQKSVGEVDAAMKRIEDALREEIKRVYTPSAAPEPPSPWDKAPPAPQPRPRSANRAPSGNEPPKQFEDLPNKRSSMEEDLFERPDVNQAKSAGGGSQKPATEAGNFAHKHLEMLQNNPQVLDDIAQRTGPGAIFDRQLPRGLEKEVRIKLPGTPAGKEPRIDRLWRQGGTIYELKPGHLAEQGAAEAQQYAEWLNRYGDPPVGGGPWRWEVVTYDQQLLMQYLRDVGVMKP